MKKFYILEISAKFQNSDEFIITMYNGKTYKNFDTKEEEKDFFLFFFNQSKNKFDRIFILNPTMFITLLLKHVKSNQNITLKPFLAKNEIYTITVKNGDKIIKISNIAHLAPNLFSVSENDYIHIPFWSDGGETTNDEEKIKKKTITLENQKNNCLYLYKLLKIYNNNFEKIIKNWFHKPSLSSISKEIFFTNFNRYGINFNQKLDEDSNIRPSYYGGRCEVLGNPYNLEKYIFHYDFKNMYGNIMLEDFPVGDLELCNTIDKVEKPGFYYVRVKSNHEWLPVLPHRTSYFNDLNINEIIYSNGEFEGLYYSDELIYFQKTGGEILEIKYAYIYNLQKNLPIFKDFSESVINLREHGENRLWKNILVSFYGRLGMSPIKTKTIIINENEYKNTWKTLKIENETWFSGFALIEIQEDEVKVDSKVEYASIITARARIKLHKHLILTKNLGGRPLYCDTDSIFTSFKTDMGGKKMGEIIWTDKSIEDAVFFSTRGYSIKKKNSWETKIAGISRNQYPFEIIKKKFYSDFDHSLSYWKHYFSVFSKKEWNYEKTLKLNKYDKRVLSEDKKRTKPWKKINDVYKEE